MSGGGLCDEHSDRRDDDFGRERRRWDDRDVYRREGRDWWRNEGDRELRRMETAERGMRADVRAHRWERLRNPDHEFNLRGQPARDDRESGSPWRAFGVRPIL